MIEGAVPNARSETRYEVHLTASVVTDWQKNCQAEITNISPQGLCLEGTRELVDNLFPNFNPPKGQPRARTEVSFSCNSASGPLEGMVRVVCHTAYVRRLTQQRYQVGMHFVEITESSLALLEQLIEWLQQRQDLDPV